MTLQKQAPTVRRPGIIANPADGCKAAAEFFGDRRRQPGVRVVESAREQIAFTGAVQRKQPSVTFARIPFPRRNQQIHFASQPRQRRHHRAAGAVFHHQLRNKKRIRKIGERVAESLLRVHAPQRVEIGVSVFADAHRYVNCGEVISRGGRSETQFFLDRKIFHPDLNFSYL
jgi:hypothetical protein